MRSFTSSLILGAACAVLNGCGVRTTGLDPHVDREVFGVAVQEYAPQPVYKRTRLVYLPSPAPSLAMAANTAPLMLPVVHLDLKEVTLEEAAKSLGESARYSSYCASSIADQVVTLNTLGTIDELAEAISRQARIKVVVDHHNHEVRFTARPQPVEPKLFDDKTVKEG